MKKTLFHIFILTFTTLPPITAFSFNYEPCYLKKIFDDNHDIPADTYVALVGGHQFRKKDLCVPMEALFTWKDQFKSIEHNWYEANIQNTVPGEFWYSVDREEYVIVANPLNYSGTDLTSQFSASGEDCINSSSGICREWTTFG
ncbi:MAG: hypothetical protein A2451_04405 [Bdellovibrionales bacterium RIFOXYC2_FULL_39_8]|nr:MAG: hypothetical protein A2451_04405 [Bdellovibrionales bacterium RIFOXYC2_FULL_39_8]